jgi:hypothetical protein
VSNYFNEVEFELREDPSIKPEPPKDIDQIDKDKLKTVIEEIREEFKLIASGESELTHYAIDPGRFASPVSNRLDVLAQSPSFDNMRRFLQAARQDLGAAASDHFKSLLSGTIKEADNE